MNGNGSLRASAVTATMPLSRSIPPSSGVRSMDPSDATTPMDISSWASAVEPVAPSDEDVEMGPADGEERAPRPGQGVNGVALGAGVGDVFAGGT